MAWSRAGWFNMTDILTPGFFSPCVEEIFKSESCWARRPWVQDSQSLVRVNAHLDTVFLLGKDLCGKICICFRGKRKVPSQTLSYSLPLERPIKQ